MDRYERILSLHRILKTSRYPVTVARLQEELECSRATVYRDLAFLRDALMAPIVGDGEADFRYDAEARDIEEAELDTHLAGSYGIFSGPAKGVATIVFSAKAARWVADEHWHSQQQGRLLPDGRYELKLPYSASRELLMDVLHYGADAEIVAPPALREQAKSLLQLALSNYER